MSTATLIGVLQVEGTPIYGNGGERSGERTSGAAFRPVGTPLRNDGIRRHWMLRGEAYRLHHDGTGWRVTNDLFDGHVYRLVESADMQLVGHLPVDGGPLELAPGIAYEIREQEPLGPWAVYQL